MGRKNRFSNTKERPPRDALMVGETEKPGAAEESAPREKVLPLPFSDGLVCSAFSESVVAPVKANPNSIPLKKMLELMAKLGRCDIKVRYKPSFMKRAPRGRLMAAEGDE